MHLEIAGHILDLCNCPDDVLRASVSTVIGAPDESVLAKQSPKDLGPLTSAYSKAWVRRTDHPSEVLLGEARFKNHAHFCEGFGSPAVGDFGPARI